MNRVVHVVADRSERDEPVAFFAQRFFAAYSRWGHDDIRNLDDQQRAFDQTALDHFVIGEPGECIEQLQSYQELGIEHCACPFNFGKPDPDKVSPAMKLFGEKVLPELK